MTRDEFIAHLREQLLTQDNACTSYPMFVVQKRVTDFGFEPDYCDEICFIDTDGDYRTVYPGDEGTPSYDELESMHEKDELPSRWTRTGFKRRWKFIIEVVLSD